MIGNYKCSVDEKGRITIPSKLRTHLSSTIYITRDLDDLLAIRSDKQFKEHQENLLQQSSFSKDARNLQRAIFGNTFEVDIDKQGRVLLPKSHIEALNIKEDVVVVASGNRIEIFTLAQWDAFSKKMYDNKELEKAAENIYEI